MDNAQEIVQSLWEPLEPQIEALIKKMTNDCNRWKPMVVVSANNEVMTATVREIYGNADGREDYVNIPNISGKALNSGDSVFVQYVYGATNAMVAYKNA
ncbi:MAG: hypothetical protein AB9836_04425 [Aminipila sp.]